jgi:hypothetical protein
LNPSILLESEQILLAAGSVMEMTDIFWRDFPTLLQNDGQA